MIILNRHDHLSGIYTLSSALLGREVSYYAILPENYRSSAAPLPVLYLLHGLFGSHKNWLENTRIVEYAAESPFVIVCPEGGDNWYSDNLNSPFHFYESFFYEELFPAVESEFNVAADRNSRAIAGLSMGGYGAFKFAFRRPELFCLALSMSGAFHAAEICEDNAWTELQPSIAAVFGGNEKVRKANDLFQIAENFPAERIRELPFLYFDCGLDDGFLEINRRLARVFERREIAHEFNEFSGGHDWNYWNYQLCNILKTAGHFLK